MAQAYHVMAEATAPRDGKALQRRKSAHMQLRILYLRTLPKPISIRDPRAAQLARLLASRRHTTMTAAIIDALENELRREQRKTPLRDRLGEIARETRAGGASGPRHEPGRDRRHVDALMFIDTSPLVRLETCMVLASKHDISLLRAQRQFDRLIAEAGIEIVAVTDAMGVLAVDAFERYGKGRGGKAKLNLADCVSYACAKSLGAPILCIGRDFSHTDLATALA